MTCTPVCTSDCLYVHRHPNKNLTEPGIDHGNPSSNGHTRVGSTVDDGGTGGNTGLITHRGKEDVPERNRDD